MKTIILSLTPVTDEPRVLRQAQALIRNGFDVTVVGLSSRSPAPKDWNLKTVSLAQWNRATSNHPIDRAYLYLEKRIAQNPKSVSSKAFALFKKGLGALGRIKNLFSWIFLRSWRPIPCLLGRWFNKPALYYYWSGLHYGFVYDQMRGMEADLFIAHDYFTAPICDRLAQECGGKVVVDCHEHATSQYAFRPLWSYTIKPWVDRMQRLYLPKAEVVTTVCDGIAQLLTKDYSLKRDVAVVRSVPFYSEQPYRPCEKGPIVVLYHGLVSEGRGLEDAIDSLPLWREEFQLVIRGGASESYLAELKARAEQNGVSDRVTFDPPVLFSEMVAAANKADIGFFVQRDTGPQKRFTLPNKFFEYLMAGLALCVADLPEMARILRQHDLGVLVPDATPEAIAAAINSFDRDQINRCKQRALLAAKELCWENESHQMVALYREALAGRKS